MKISIVTVTIDSDAVLNKTVESVRHQSHVDIEHIVIDGNKNRKIPRGLVGNLIYHEPKGIYEAINFGLTQTTGEVVGLLHGGDAFASSIILETVSKAFEEDPALDFVYGDIVFVSRQSNRDGRIYHALNFRPSHLAFGMAPPHPSLYIRRKAMEKIGKYNEEFKLAADLDMWMRIFADKSLKGRYLPEIFVRMSTGGASTSLKGRLYANNREKLMALRLNGFSPNPLKLLLKYILIARDALFAKSPKK